VNVSLIKFVLFLCSYCSTLGLGLSRDRRKRFQVEMGTEFLQSP
jgi:hypothetical protein